MNTLLSEENVSNRTSVRESNWEKLDAAVSFKVYRALLTQVAAADPTVEVLRNSLANAIVWTRTGAGEYTGTLAGAFPADKTFGIGGSTDDGDPLNAFPLYVRRGSDDTILVKTIVSGALADDLLVSTPIEVCVYP